MYHMSSIQAQLASSCFDGALQFAQQGLHKDSFDHQRGLGQEVVLLLVVRQ